MNDLDLIRTLDDTELLTTDDLRWARSRLLAGITQQPARSTPHPWRMTWSIARGRRALVGGTVLALVVAAFIGFAVGGTHSSNGPARAGGTPRPVQSTATDPSATKPVRVTVNAAVFLAKAVTAAQAEPDVVPRPDQFYYMKDGIYEAWLSMDGTHDGRIITSDGQVTAVPGCRDGVQAVIGNQTGSQPCTPQPAYLADAPTTAQAMATYLSSKFGGAGTNGLGKGLLSVAEFNYLKPAARAALFEAAPLLPGLQMSAAPVTNLGHAAVAITWKFSGSTTTVLFDPTTHAYLGCQTASASGPAGDTTAVLTGIVDAVGDRP